MSTLIGNPQLLVNFYKKEYGLTISSEFLICADSQLTKLFELKTAIKPSERVSGSYTYKEDFFYEPAEISKMAFKLYINHNWNPGAILWKSKSGRIYKIEDTDIDCADIEFWFADLDVALIHRQMFPNQKLPFKLSNLSYELVFTRIDRDGIIEMTIRKANAEQVQEILTKIDHFMNAFNEKSMKVDRRYGIINHWNHHIEDEKIIYQIDMGSTGFDFLKKLLLFLSSMEVFTKIEIC